MTSPAMASYGAPPRPDVTEAAARLAELNAFPGASKSELKKIALAGHTVTIREGWSLMWEKTPADKAYFVLHGKLSVRHGHDEFAQLGEGDLVGEMAIVHHQLRNATVVAATDLEVLHFTTEAVEALRSTVPAFAEAVERTAVSRLVG
ncbi:MAG TPA: cyclic nucleotide-binding domain-containing protein [Nocardioidaceae bacterium]|nr:cyclic nucleotide-binding domain-containing protein [Nocardioidaceae bacterium]